MRQNGVFVENKSESKLQNTRDLGGTKTKDGKTIVKGLLYRSASLNDLPKEDTAWLSEHVQTIVDLRSDEEFRKQPDDQIPGVKLYHIPVVNSFTAGITREEKSDKDWFSNLLDKPKEAKDFMCRQYRSFTSDYSLSELRKFLEVLLNDNGAVLWHCAGGKDRTGVAAAVIQEILGVPREDIIADYLKTNEFVEGNIQTMTALFKKNSGTENSMANKAIRCLIGAMEEYIETFYSAAEQKYGSIENLIHEGLHVNDEEIEVLKRKYLEG